MRHFVLLDFGSTFTKLSVADRQAGDIVHTARFPSTVRSDATICLEQCFESARCAIGADAFERSCKLASSSAAGGLRMAVIGLSHTLSTSAGRNAAFGAGAKILGTFVGKLTEEDMARLEKLNVEIILFCGGYEDGSTASVEHNATMLAASAVSAPVIYAGNSRMAQTVRSLFLQAKKSCFIVHNIIPRVGALETKPSERIIRDVFMKTIVNMKGLSGVQARLDGPLTPTPAAVLEAGELLSLGTSSEEGVGPLMIVDIGGATTDVHSYVEQTGFQGARLMGSPEPYARRTVEGDMGMRESSICLMEELGWEKTAGDLGIPPESLRQLIHKRVENTNYVPDCPLEQKVDHIIAAGAVHVSARRHSGRIKYVHSSNVTSLQYGKNVSPIRTVIGTGGPLVNSADPGAILRRACSNPRDADVLLPDSAEFYLDARYVFYAAGILRQHDADLAMRIMKNSLSRL
ncbi:MAG: glutamate mutase L [Planctomycetaceae bacterium]|nr:glutamate mutase L [Planctomycetaceae bacterium]